MNQTACVLARDVLVRRAAIAKNRVTEFEGGATAMMSAMTVLLAIVVGFVVVVFLLVMVGRQHVQPPGDAAEPL